MTALWELLPGWRWATMGEIAKVVGGSTPKTSEPSYWGGEIPWITPDDLSGFTGKYIERGRRSVTQAGYDSCSTQMVPAGTVLFTSRAPIGYVAIARNPVCTNQGFKSFVCGPHAHPDYVYWWLRASRDLVASMASGTTFAELSGTAAGRVPIPVPTLDDQRLIAAIIEQEISRIEAGQSELLRTIRSVAVLRRSVIAAATAGSLVPNQAELGGRYESAQDFVRRVSGLRARSRRSGKPTAWVPPTRPLPVGWTWARLRDLGELDRGRSRHRPRNDPRLYGGQYPFVQTGDIRRSRGTVREHSQTYSDAGLAQSRLWPAGTLCITIAANIAETAILTYPACFPDSVVGFVNESEIVLTRYVQVSLQAMKQQLWELAPATAQKNINLATLDAVAIPLPPPEEQTRIVGEVDRMISLADVIEAAAEAALRRSEGMQTSLLRSVFTHGHSGFRA